MTRSLKVSVGVVSFMVLATVAAVAMIKALPLPDLVRQADLVVVATVESISQASVDREQISTMKNVLKLDKTLKGDWAAAQPLVVLTQQRGAYGEVGSLEDQVEFPKAGKQVLLFLKKAGPDKLALVNDLQGVWPIEGDKLHGFGTGVKMSAVVEVIESQRLN